jgi:hypothetical protein
MHPMTISRLSSAWRSRNNLSKGHFVFLFIPISSATTPAGNLEFLIHYTRNCSRYKCR